MSRSFYLLKLDAAAERERILIERIKELEAHVARQDEKIFDLMNKLRRRNARMDLL